MMSGSAPRRWLALLVAALALDPLFAGLSASLYAIEFETDPIKPVWSEVVDGLVLATSVVMGALVLFAAGRWLWTWWWPVICLAVWIVLWSGWTTQFWSRYLPERYDGVLMAGIYFWPYYGTLGAAIVVTSAAIGEWAGRRRSRVLPPSQAPEHATG